MTSVVKQPGVAHIIAAMAVALMLSLAVTAPTAAAHAASPASHPTISRAVAPHSQAIGGGCNSVNYSNIPLHIGSCIAENGSGFIIPDGYISNLNNHSSGWSYCDFKVDYYDVFSGYVYPGDEYNCLGPLQGNYQGHYYGQTGWLAKLGHFYYATANFDVVYCTNVCNEYTGRVTSPYQYT